MNNKLRVNTKLIKLIQFKVTEPLFGWLMRQALPR